jgi:hypothetical protein
VILYYFLFFCGVALGEKTYIYICVCVCVCVFSSLSRPLLRILSSNSSSEHIIGKSCISLFSFWLVEYL